MNLLGDGPPPTQVASSSRFKPLQVVTTVSTRRSTLRRPTTPNVSSSLLSPPVPKKSRPLSASPRQPLAVENPEVRGSVASATPNPLESPLSGRAVRDTASQQQKRGGDSNNNNGDDKIADEEKVISV